MNLNNYCRLLLEETHAFINIKTKDYYKFLIIKNIINMLPLIEKVYALKKFKIILEEKK